MVGECFIHEITEIDDPCSINQGYLLENDMFERIT